MPDIVLFGVGQIAEVAKAYLDWEGSHRVVAFTVNAAYRTQETKDGLPVVAWETLEISHPPGQVSLFCPISYRGVNQYRKDRFLEGQQRGYDFISFIHPKAYYYGTPVGLNCFIMEACILQPCTTIGDNCILWSGSHIGHHTTIRSHSFVATATVGGSADVGERCLLGGKCSVRDNVRLGEATVVGATAYVDRDMPDHSVIAAPKSRISRLKSFQLRRI